MDDRTAPGPDGATTEPASATANAARRVERVARFVFGAAAVLAVVLGVAATAVAIRAELRDGASVASDPQADASTSMVPPTSVVTTTITVPPTTTTAPPTTTTTTTTVPAEVRYSWGSTGPEVRALQERLVELGYWIPVVGGDYDSVTAQAVMAFQKWEGLARDGVAGPQTLGALAGATPVRAREGGDHVEIDLDRQIMFIIRDGQQWVFNTSTGRSGWRTPRGRFTITRQIDGLRRAPLGNLWRPKYFNQGIAMHGSSSIPGYPASHGCARLHNDAIDLVWEADLAPIGTTVWVY